MKKTIRFTLNAQEVAHEIDPERSLLWLLRIDHGLTGTKYGCGMGHCGTCTVLIDDKPVRSCQVTAEFAEGKEVVTIEGLSNTEKLHPVQQAFVQHDALQCGYCTPGMIMTATGFLLKNPAPSREQIIEGMDENFCRCGAYTRIIDAIEEAALSMKGGVLHEK
ncbi:MAG: (2Fe-2S)-binding protein [Cyclobacteriaceae bacterium]|nr:(2Fe-2S)-binding protein [Cyclobacteriaceae bacterium]